MSGWRALIASTVLLASAHTPANGQPASASPPATQAAIDALQRTLEAQQILIARQAEELEAQRRSLASLQQRLDETRAAALAVREQLAALRQGADPQAMTQTLATRLEAIERVVQRLPELPQNLVTGGDFPGSITVPGADAAFRIGGELRATAIQTLGPLGEDDRFITSSIPVGGSPPGENARTVYTASPTRLNFDLRGPAPFGTVRTFIEADFAGSGNAFRLRHAYVQTARWLFGQTWSTFDDPEAQPIEIDFEGLNAISRFRQAQIRFTHELTARWNLALALENPAPDLTGAQGVNLVPDLVGRIRWQLAGSADRPVAERAHVHVAFLARSLRAAQVGSPDDRYSAGGFGINVSGVVVPAWDRDNRIRFGSNNGWGIGRYIKDLEALGGQDAVFDLAAGRLRALPVASVYVAYEHAWRPSLWSTITYGAVAVDNLDVQPADALRSTRRLSVNMMWNPMPRADLILEFLTGRRTNNDGAHNSSQQVQLGWRMRF